MKLNIYTGQQGSLVKEIKSGWKQKMLSATSLFFHGGPIDIPTVKNEGIDAVKSGKEWVIDPDNKPIGGGKLVFAFLVGGDIASWDKPKGVDKLWGSSGQGYIFEVQSGSVFFSQGDAQPTHGQEIAFYYKIESGDIKYYSAPSSNARERTPSKYDKSALNRNGTQQRAFQVVPWSATTAKLINDVLV
jgi:hypothetical protein